MQTTGSRVYPNLYRRTDKSNDHFLWLEILESERRQENEHTRQKQSMMLSQGLFVQQDIVFCFIFFGDQNYIISVKKNKFSFQFLRNAHTHIKDRKCSRLNKTVVWMISAWASSKGHICKRKNHLCMKFHLEIWSIHESFFRLEF